MNNSSRAPTMLLCVLVLVIHNAASSQLLLDPDINDDHFVNFLDVSLFTECFNTDVTLNPECVNRDFDGDGFVNFIDLTAIKDNFLATFPTAREAELLFQGFRHTVSRTLIDIAAGDINSDGITDIVGARSVSGPGGSQTGVTILTGTPGGDYIESHTPEFASFSPVAIKLDLINDDAFPDIVVLLEASAFAVLLNDGSGDFSPAVIYPVAGTPIEMSIADVTGNGILDVVVIDFLNVSVHPGMIDGTFGAPKLTQVLTSPESLAIEDMNGDTIDDVILTVDFPSEIVILENDGLGNFDQSTTIATSIIPENITVSDLNADSFPDLIVSTRFSPPAVEVLYGNALGQYAAATPIALEIAPDDILTGDLNDDGFDDIITLNTFDASASILLSIDGQTFEVPKVYAVSEQPYAAIADDLDGDQVDDLMVYGRGPSALWSSLSSGDSIFTPPASFANGLSQGPLVSGDFNSDGNTDIVSANPGFQERSISLFPGDGTSGFGAATTYFVGQPVTDIDVGDFNNDNQPDIIVGSQFNDSIDVLLGAGDGTFNAVLPSIDCCNVLSVSAIDVDSDGNLDIWVEASFGPRFYLGNGDGTFGEQSSFGVSEIDVTVVDVNNDNINDLVSIDPSSRNVRLRIGQAMGGFSSPQELDTASFAEGLSVNDLNEDGFVDLVVGYFGAPSYNGISILSGDGTGAFDDELIYSDVVIDDPQIIDVNLDGNQDIVSFSPLSVASNGFTVLLGNGDGGFQPPAYFNTKLTPEGIIVDDFDGDGAPDVVTSSSRENVIELNINRAATIRLSQWSDPKAPW